MAGRKPKWRSTLETGVEALSSGLIILLLVLISSSSQGANEIIRIGVSEFAERSINLALLPPTIKAIQDGVGKERVEVKTLSVSRLQEAVRAGKIDIVISSAGTFRRLAIAGTGIRDLATISSERAPNPNYADGSVFFTLASRSDITTVPSMRGLNVAAMHAFAFSGWQIASGELFKRGYNPDHFFSRVAFYGHDAMAVVNAVLAGHEDVGVVRTCFLEDIGIDMAKIKVIGAQPSEGKINCVRSTSLYPNWTVSTLPSTPPEVSRKITAILLQMPNIESGLHWSVATDFRGIDQLFWDLKIGPYEYLRHFNVRRFLFTYWAYILPIVIVLLGLLGHVLTVSYLVRKRTRALEEALVREKQMQHEAERAQARFEQMQRVGVVGQMSSMIAHELRQPLASISLFVEGLLRRLDNQRESPERMVKTLERIAEQTERASRIVDQVRGYAKGNRARSPQDLVAISQQALNEIHKVTRGLSAKIQTRFPAHKPLWVEANALEVELVILNLLKNAIESSDEHTSAQVTLTLDSEGDWVSIRIANSGPYITDEQWEAIQAASMPSTKRYGLGLGLPIVRSIIDDLGGKLIFERPQRGGLICIVRLRQCDYVEPTPLNGKGDNE